MRLICPNCDAQYEVVDDVIPAEGRDVQCSNCGQTWFQHHPDHMPDEPEEAELPAAEQEPADDPAQDEAEAQEAPPEPQRRELDPEVAGILREEAELENQARATETDGLESQPDLGLDNAESEADKRTREARERMAKMRGEEAEPAQVSEEAATAAAIGSRRDLLPDIDEINSTLRSTSDREAGDQGQAADALAETAPRKSGFRRGFSLMLLLAVILLAVYVFAPRIAQSVPQADAALNAYVTFVDNARVWLDGQVAAGLTWLDNLTASEGE